MSEQVGFKKIEGYVELAGLPCIDPAKIKTIPGYNVRDTFSPDTDDEDAKLVASLAANGFVPDKPVTIRIVDNVAYVIAGHRRVDASNHVNVEAVKAADPKLKGKGKDLRPIRGITFIAEAKDRSGAVRGPVEMSYDLELSNNGKPLAPGERGANILRLRSMGEDDATIGRRLGIGTRWVADLAKLGRSDPRLKALVKTGVIPPTTAILLTRAHGETKGLEIAEAAAGMAKAEGKAVATGKTVAKAEAAAGVQPKVGGKNKAAKGRDKTAEQPVTVTVAPEKPASKTAGKTVALLAGPFTLGRDLEERTIYDVNGVALCEMADVAMARGVLQIIMLGWGVLKGTASPAAASPAKGKASKAAAAVPPVTVPAPVAPISAAEREAAKAEREARVARQVLAADAPRVANAEAVKAAAAALGKGKPLAALVAANAAKVTAKAKAEAKAAADLAAKATAEADRLAKEEAEAIRLAAVEAAGLASPAKGKASVKAVVAAKATAKTKANGAAKTSRK